MSFKVWLKDFTTDLNQPAFKTAVAGTLTVGTAGVYWICVFATIPIQEEAWWAWLLFLGGLWGITAFDYKTKRQTTFGAPTDTTVIAQDQSTTVVNPGAKPSQP